MTWQQVVDHLISSAFAWPIVLAIVSLLIFRGISYIITADAAHNLTKGKS